jgi:hypothetical protein
MRLKRGAYFDKNRCSALLEKMLKNCGIVSDNVAQLYKNIKMNIILHYDTDLGLKNAQIFFLTVWRREPHHQM